MPYYISRINLSFRTISAFADDEDKKLKKALTLYSMAEKEYIQVRGARANNLKNIDVDIPRGEFVVVTGLAIEQKTTGNNTYSIFLSRIFG